MSVVKYGLPGAAGEHDDAPLLDVPDGAPADEGLRDGPHLDGGQDARRDPLGLEGVLEREGIDDGGEHAHVVGLRPVHAGGAGGDATEDVAPADDDGQFDAQRADLADLPGDLGRGGAVDAVALPAHQGFP